jgi:hypothetical protein
VLVQRRTVLSLSAFCSWLFLATQCSYCLAANGLEPEDTIEVPGARPSSAMCLTDPYLETSYPIQNSPPAYVRASDSPKHRYLTPGLANGAIDEARVSVISVYEQALDPRKKFHKVRQAANYLARTFNQYKTPPGSSFDPFRQQLEQLCGSEAISRLDKQCKQQHDTTQKKN